MKELKTFNNLNLTKSQLRNKICVFAKKLGVTKVIFNNRAKHISGSYNAFNRVMFLDLKLSKIKLLHTFFHELGHNQAVAKNKWARYHYNPTLKAIAYERLFYIENKIDLIGKTLWNKHVDSSKWGKYKYSYPKAQKNNILKTFQ